MLSGLLRLQRLCPQSSVYMRGCRPNRWVGWEGWWFGWFGSTALPAVEAVCELERQAHRWCTARIGVVDALAEVYLKNKPEYLKNKPKYLKNKPEYLKKKSEYLKKQPFHLCIFAADNMRAYVHVLRLRESETDTQNRPHS